LHRLVQNGHGAEALDLLLSHGADPRRARADGRTSYELAMRAGNLPAAERLRAAGGAVELRPEDAFLHAAALGDETEARRILAAHDLDLAREEPEGGTPLHWMAWHGRVGLVRLLVQAGAPVNRRDKTYGSSPIAWAAHGSANCRHGDAEYIAIVDVLLEAGAEREPSFNRWGAPPEELASAAVAAHLRSRGFAPATEA
jgi:ankyrin repeat protein